MLKGAQTDRDSIKYVGLNCVTLGVDRLTGNKLYNWLTFVNLVISAKSVGKHLLRRKIISKKKFETHNTKRTNNKRIIFFVFFAKKYDLKIQYLYNYLWFQEVFT